MNRFVTQVSTVCLCLAMVPAAHAIGKKKKKQSDLSTNPLGSVNSKQPDKELFDKAMRAMQKGKYDVARLDLQTLLNTYPDTEYAMRAKLAVGDTWYKEGGSAALTQAEQEYKDFITFFPNTPEAAEAQMKVGDIYFQQMQKPDRDPQNVMHAETEYRQMVQQFPDSPLVPRAKQRLRDVQEVLAQRQFEIGQFYASHENWPATIARLQTVADSYPLFSHSDQTLITLGDGYVTQAQLAGRLNLPPKAKAELIRAYNDRAADAYSRVVTVYAMAPHVEDAKDRLIAMGRPVPEPTQAQLAESEAEEGSRTTVKLKDRAMLLVKQGPSTVRAARVGEPTMADATQTTAPQVRDNTVAMFNAAMKGEAMPPAPTYGGGATTASAAAAASTGAAPSAATGNGTAVEMEAVPTGTSGGNSTSVEIVNPSASSSGNSSSGAAPAGAGNEAAPGVGNGASPAAAAPAPAGNPAGAGAPDPNFGLKPVGPAATNAALPPVDKPAEAPDQVNDVKAGNQPAQVQTGTKKGKAKNVPVDKSKESSSKKKKTGLDKLNPF
ncbi:outer membrane protein assembly factor BamD [Alloacidobacterium dinghuense]|uniref:Outer membrane protein assembly factor BamD n=1 Tax=Alloacidobacterium dinghuense TaxID=2763107 RepID=A0A7G8BL20_9BACT|nr:outer membrane protein assembly factor BamD [Alloacidobacterium dinghuense]QNI33240.1 outer membrane protein assembly factor BamD [Alloacidobacterium dinghuense]